MAPEGALQLHFPCKHMDLSEGLFVVGGRHFPCKHIRDWRTPNNLKRGAWPSGPLLTPLDGGLHCILTTMKSFRKYVYLCLSLFSHSLLMSCVATAPGACWARPRGQ